MKRKDSERMVITQWFMFIDMLNDIIVYVLANNISLDKHYEVSIRPCCNVKNFVFSVLFCLADCTLMHDVYI